MSRFINKLKAYIEKIGGGSRGSAVITAMSDSLVRKTTLTLELKDKLDTDRKLLIKLIMRYPYVISYSSPVISYGTEKDVHIEVETIGDRSHDMKQFLEKHLKQV